MSSGKEQSGLSGHGISGSSGQQYAQSGTSGMSGQPTQFGQEQKQQKQFPDLIGLNVDQARQRLLQECPKANIEIIEEEKFNKLKGTQEFKTDRIRVVTDKNNKVLYAPKMG